MSEKRLSSEDVAERWSGRGQVSLEELRADHLQAREDVRRLAEELRAASDYEDEHTGSRCWCSGGREAPCYVGTPSDLCLRRNLLLREVEVSQ